MARRTSQAAFRALVEAARARISDLGISTDLITGFPGETEAEFETGYTFVHEMEFMKLHVFRYSPRGGTAAARMAGQVAEDVKKERSARLLALSDEGARRFAESLIDRTMPVLWEQITGASEAGFANHGLTDNYVRVEMDAPVVLTNLIAPARIVAATEHGLRAEWMRAEC
jgi:threonylcarbamoyladenosine tRNA methylthiotransferase MtaB